MSVVNVSVARKGPPLVVTKIISNAFNVPMVESTILIVIEGAKSGKVMWQRNPSISDSLIEQDWMNWPHAMAEQYYKEPITLKEFSRMCGMSPSSLSQKFKLRTGSSFVQYKHHLQSKEACRLLIETDLPIIRIAGETGFDDLSYFYRVFRKVVGETPSQYRKKRKERLSGRIAAEDDPL
jgi:AraC-like DNA-binding protein